MPEPQCQLAVDIVSGDVEGLCGFAGDKALNQECFSASDCAPGLGCVGDNGRCRPYCCDDLEACPASTYCAPAPMAKADVPEGTPTPFIPVCVAAVNCTLLDDSTCPDETQTCTIVRQDGTTSCVAPGAGKLGDPCSCAAGFVCSTAVNECKQLCHIGSAKDCPSDHSCQGGALNYPDGFGVCVEQ